MQLDSENSSSGNTISEETKAKKKRRFVRKNPHLIDTCFYHHCELMVKNFFKINAWTPNGFGIVLSTRVEAQPISMDVPDSNLIQDCADLEWK